MLNFKQRSFSKKDLRNSLKLAQLSKLIYHSPHFVMKKLQTKWNAQDAYCQNHDNDMQFALAKFPKGLVLVFKGTKEAQDWLVNIKTQKVDGPWKTKVHRGFYEALSEIWEDINNKLQEFQTSSLQPLWITGHSLGGALATLAAARFIEERRKVHAMYSFGSPRVGNKEFSIKFNERIPHAIRFVNNEDLVARIPKFSFAHVGQKCYFNQDCQILFNPSSFQTRIEWMNQINFRSLKLKGSMIKHHPGSIQDHDMDAYIHCLKKSPYSRDKDISALANFREYING